MTMERLLREVQAGALERDPQGWLEGLVEGDATGMRAIVQVAKLTHGESKGEAAAGMLLSVLESIAAKPRPPGPSHSLILNARHSPPPSRPRRLLGAAVRAGAALTRMACASSRARTLDASMPRDSRCPASPFP